MTFYTHAKIVCRFVLSKESEVTSSGPASFASHRQSSQFPLGSILLKTLSHIFSSCRRNPPRVQAHEISRACFCQSSEKRASASDGLRDLSVFGGYSDGWKSVSVSAESVRFLKMSFLSVIRHHSTASLWKLGDAQRLHPYARVKRSGRRPLRGRRENNSRSTFEKWARNVAMKGREMSP